MKIKKADKFLRLPKLISNGMILQRGQNIKIWGWANEGDEVIVKLLHKEYRAHSNNLNEWAIITDKLEPCDPFDIVISTFDCIKIENVLVGDVWICSGQSNMELPLSRVKNMFKNEISAIDNKYIRQFQIECDYDFNTQRDDFSTGSWKEATQENIMTFSAVGYFFAEYTYNLSKIPVGLILNAIGGAPIQAWLSEDSIKKFPQYHDELKLCKDSEYVSTTLKSDEKKNNAWYSYLNKKDKGLNEEILWYDEKYNDTKWEEIELLSDWFSNEELNKNGSYWFRKVVDIPTECSGKEGKLLLGCIVDADYCYINGVFIGETGYKYPPREYVIPQNILKPGKNVIAVRVISYKDTGGFTKDKPYKICIGDFEINLNNVWKYKKGCNTPGLADQTFFHYKPSGLYNALVYPLKKYITKGVLWYQGESNVESYENYFDLFLEMTNNWRALFNNVDFPFIYTQLAGYGAFKEFEPKNNLAKFRHEQTKCLKIDNTKMIVAYDLGEWNDLHPQNKKSVGVRLALASQNLLNQNLEPVLSPVFEKYEFIKSDLVLHFKYCETGLFTKDSKKAIGFILEFLNGKYESVTGIIDFNKVVIKNIYTLKDEAVALYYAWAGFPLTANLINKNNLPVSPFMTTIDFR